MKEEKSNSKIHTRGFFYPYPHYQSVKPASMAADSFLEKRGFRFKVQYRFLWLEQLRKRVSQYGSYVKSKFFRDTYAAQYNHILPPHWREVMQILVKKGFLLRYHLKPTYFDLPKIFRVALESGDLRGSNDPKLPRFNVFGQATRVDFEDALSRAFGEFVERLPFLAYREADFQKATPVELAQTGVDFLHPLQVAAFSEAQRSAYSQLQINEQDSFLWTFGENIIRNKAVLVPTQLVYWTYNVRHKGWQEKVIRESNTSGLASGRTYKEAVVGAIYELIQRDGYLIFWLNKIAPPVIDVSYGLKHEELKDLIKKCQRYNLKITFLNTQTDLSIPSCVCALEDETGAGPRVTVGAGAGGEWESVLYSALCEALAVHLWMRDSYLSGEAYICIDSFSDPRIKKTTLEERVKLWAHPEMFDRFAFFLSGTSVPLEDLKKSEKKFTIDQEYDHLLNLFGKMGQQYEPIVCRGKHGVLDLLNTESVRVIIPALVPMYLYESAATWGAERLRDVPKKLGYQNAVDYYPWPHPLA